MSASDDVAAIAARRMAARNNAELLASICQKARHSQATAFERDEALRDAAAMLRQLARATNATQSDPA